MRIADLVAPFKGRFVRDAAFYAGFGVLDRAIPFLLLPVITRYLPPEEYGVYVLFQAVLGFVMPFVTVNVDSAILVSYFGMERRRFAVYFTNGLLIVAAGLLVTGGVVIVAADPIGELVHFPAIWLWAVVLLCLLNFFTRLCLNLWQVEKKPRPYGIFTVLLTLTLNGLMVVLVVAADASWQGLIVSQLIAYGLFSIVSVVQFVKRGLFVFEWDPASLRDCFRTGFPLTLHNLGSWMGSLATRVILGSLVGVAATGSFAVGATFGMVVLLVQDAFNKAYIPYLFERLQAVTDATKHRLVRLTYAYNAALFGFALAVSAVGLMAVEPIFGTGYSDARVFVLWIALGYAFDGMYKMHVNYVFYRKKTQWIFLITMTSGLLNVGLCYLLVGAYGAVGAAQALCISQLASYLLAWKVGQRAVPLPWFTSKVASPSVA